MIKIKFHEGGLVVPNFKEDTVVMPYIYNFLLTLDEFQHTNAGLPGGERCYFKFYFEAGDGTERRIDLGDGLEANVGAWEWVEAHIEDPIPEEEEFDYALWDAYNS